MVAPRWQSYLSLRTTRRGSRWWSARRVLRSSRRGSVSQCSVAMRWQSCGATPALRILHRRFALLRGASLLVAMLRSELGMGRLRRCRPPHGSVRLMRALLPFHIEYPLHPVREWRLRHCVCLLPCRCRRRPLWRARVRHVPLPRRCLLRFQCLRMRCKQFRLLGAPEFGISLYGLQGQRIDGAIICGSPVAIVDTFPGWALDSQTRM